MPPHRFREILRSMHNARTRDPKFWVFLPRVPVASHPACPRAQIFIRYYNVPPSTFSNPLRSRHSLHGLDARTQRNSNEKPPPRPRRLRHSVLPAVDVARCADLRRAGGAGCGDARRLVATPMAQASSSNACRTLPRLRDRPLLCHQRVQQVHCRLQASARCLPPFVPHLTVALRHIRCRLMPRLRGWPLRLHQGVQQVHVRIQAGT